MCVKLGVQDSQHTKSNVILWKERGEEGGAGKEESGVGGVEGGMCGVKGGMKLREG